MLVVGPIERMMSLVRRLAENPWGTCPREENSRRRKLTRPTKLFLLDQTLTKISGLLQVGFGAAGAEVIARSMDTSLQNQTYVLPGKRITRSWFRNSRRLYRGGGRAGRRHHSVSTPWPPSSTRALAAFHGAPNKNMGCAFLLVWKICGDYLTYNLRDPQR